MDIHLSSIHYLKLSPFNMACTAKSDSAVIYNTKGSYYPNLKRFYGVGGTVNWLRAGLPAGDVYADLKKYTIDLSGSDYDADSVTFYNRQIFSQPLIGRLCRKNIGKCHN